MSTEEKQNVRGIATASLTIKQRWHEEHFKSVDTKDHAHPKRRTYMAKPGAPSLKKFAQALLQSGDENAQKWFANKSGKNAMKRSEANAKLAALCASETKRSRRSKTK